MFEHAFGKRLRSLRKLNGYTQEQLSALLGITPEHLSNIERGKATPSFKLIEKLSHAFGTEPANLFLFPPAGADDLLEESESGEFPQDYRLYITDAAFWEYDVAADVYTWSDGLYQMFGVSRQSFTPGWEGFSKHIPPSDMRVVASCWSDLLAGRSVGPFSFRVRHIQNGVRFLIAKAEQVYDAEGNLAFLRGVTIDYTEQKNLEDALRRLQQTLEYQVQNRTRELHSMITVLGEEIADRKRAEEEAWRLSQRLSLAMEIAAVGMWEYDRSTGRLRLEESLVRALGYSPGEVEAPLAFWEERIHPDDRAMHRDARDAHFRGETDRYEATFRMRNAFGEWRWFHLIGRLSTPESSTAPVTIIGTFQNVTAMKEAELARARSEERFRDLVENIREIFWIAEPNYTTPYVSPHFEQIFQMDAAELAQDSGAFLKRVHPEDRERVKAADERLWTKEGEYDVTYRIVLPGDEVRWIHARAFPVHAEDGSIGRIVGVAEDVTAMETMNRQLEQAKTEAEQGSLAKSRFIANMSHEIRTPLTGILALLQLLTHSKLDSEQQEFVALAMSSGEYLLEIINDVLDISRIEAERMDLARTEFSPRELAQSVVSLFQPLIRQREVELRTSFDDALPARFIGDPARIKQILFNLVGNAFKFTRAGQVTISFSQEGELDDGFRMVLVEVSDTGPGIPDDKLAHIFDSFTQIADPANARPIGTGLGLAIVKSLASLMHGAVEVESAVGAGSTFRVRLPLQVAPDSASSTDSDMSAANNAGRSLRVLVAEDDPVNQKALRRMLEILGHQPVCASNGSEAIDMLRENEIDLLLLDIRMPEVNGCEVAQRIRDGALGDGLCNLPIVAVTASAMHEEQERILAAGVDHFLTKPFSIEELRSILERVAA